MLTEAQKTTLRADIVDFDVRKESRSLPNGTTIASATLAVYDPDGTDMTTRMVDGSPVVGGAGLIVSAALNYPAAAYLALRQEVQQIAARVEPPA